MNLFWRATLPQSCDRYAIRAFLKFFNASPTRARRKQYIEETSEGSGFACFVLCSPMQYNNNELLRRLRTPIGLCISHGWSIDYIQVVVAHSIHSHTRLAPNASDFEFRCDAIVKPNFRQLLPSSDRKRYVGYLEMWNI